MEDPGTLMVDVIGDGSCFFRAVFWSFLGSLALHVKSGTEYSDQINTVWALVRNKMPYCVPLIARKHGMDRLMEAVHEHEESFVAALRKAVASVVINAAGFRPKDPELRQKLFQVCQSHLDLIGVAEAQEGMSEALVQALRTVDAEGLGRASPEERERTIGMALTTAAQIVGGGSDVFAGPLEVTVLKHVVGLEVLEDGVSDCLARSKALFGEGMSPVTVAICEEMPHYNAVVSAEVTEELGLQYL